MRNEILLTNLYFFVFSNAFDNLLHHLVHVFELAFVNLATERDCVLSLHVLQKRFFVHLVNAQNILR